MRKIIFTSIILFSWIILSSCGSSFKPDRSYLNKDQITKLQKSLDLAKQKYSEAKTDAEKEKELFEIAFEYQNLGDYDSAIDYYEKNLKIDPTNYQTLNNMAVMYEEMGKITTALKYEQKLYNNYPTDTEVIGDIIRLLISNKQFDDAEGILESFAKSSVAKDNLQFISSEFVMINKAKGSIPAPKK